MTTRIALVVSGGVSLGSFEAGALTEILFQLERLNRQARRQAYVVDVITGGSAGAVTGALVARLLLGGIDARTRNLLHDVWVDSIGIEQLVDGPADGRSLFSDKHLSAIARRVFGTGPGALPFPQEPMSIAGEPLHLWFSLSNLVGLNYQYPPAAPAADRLRMTEAADGFGVTLSRRGRQPWARVAAAALASGAHPAGFSPRRLRRRLREYPGIDPTINRWLARGGRPAYYDGGIFNNEPLGPAIRLARQIDGALASDRLFLMVDPRRNEHTADERFTRPRLLHESLARLGAIVLSQAAAKRWAIDELAEVQRRGDNSVALARRLLGLRDLLAHAGVRPAQIAALRARLGDPGERAGGDAAVQRVCRQIEEALPARASLHEVGPAGGADAAGPSPRTPPDALLAELVALMWECTDVGRRPARVVQISADTGEVVGDALAGFLGFFRRSWRQHDYALGRERTRVRLERLLRVRLPRERSPDGRARGYWEYRSEPDRRPARIDPDARRAFLRRVDAVTREALRNAPIRVGPLPPPLTSWAVRRFLLRPWLRRLLDRPEGGGRPEAGAAAGTRVAG